MWIEPGSSVVLNLCSVEPLALNSKKANTNGVASSFCLYLWAQRCRKVGARVAEVFFLRGRFRSSVLQVVLAIERRPFPKR